MTTKILLDEKGWQEETELYTDLEEQELLTEKARTFCVEALLTVHGLQGKYTKQRRRNAQFMPQKQGCYEATVNFIIYIGLAGSADLKYAGKGCLPFLRIKNQVINENEILTYLDKKGFNLSSDLNTEDKLLHEGILSLIEHTLIPIELYTLWLNNENVQDTFEKYSTNYPRPLCTVLCRQKLNEVKNYLKVTGWLDKTENEITRELENLFSYFETRLEFGQYQINNQLTEADVYLFGHLQTIFESKLRNNLLLTTLERFSKLNKFCLNFSQIHLGNETMLWELV